eukprot:s507_g24.t1
MVWENLVQRAAAGLESDALWGLRLAAKDVKDVHPATAKGLAAIGVKATVKALEKEQALVVFVCEGVPTVLMQHLPVICAMKKVPIAVLAAAPETLGSAAAPFRPKQKDLQATAVALLKSCRQVPRLAELCQRLEASLPPVRVPFLRTAREALERVEEAEMPSPPEESQEAALPEEFIQLDPQPGKGFKGKAKGKGSGKSKAPKTVESAPFSGFKRARAALQGVASQRPIATEEATQMQVQVEAPENEIPAVKAASPPTARGDVEETSMTIFDFFDGMDS